MFAGSTILSPQIGGMVVGEAMNADFYVGADIRLDMNRDEIVNLLAAEFEKAGRSVAEKWADTVQWERQG